jgi:predicted enzyme related to lactoylglutathione lyase
MFGRTADRNVGGAMTLPAELAQHGVPPHWGMYVGVEKLEPAAADVARLGGGALSEVIDVPTVGRMQAMRDPQGAAFSIYEPLSPPPRAEAAPELGDVSWIELMTTDAPAALAFYQQLFGWQTTETMDMGPMGKYHMFGRHLGSMGGMMNKSPEMAEIPPNWGLYFRVADLDAAVERVKAGGGQILNGPMEVPGGDRIVNCMDAQGAPFSLHAKKA